LEDIHQADDFTRSMIAAASAVPYEMAAEKIRERVRHVVLDWIGVAIAGARQPSAQAVQRMCLAEGGNATATVIGSGHRFTARQAALAAGVASHALDFDDMGVGGHPSVVVLPAVFAMAEETGASGKAVAQAIVRAFEVMDRVSRACGNSQYPRGFHSTGTFGAFAATMGAAQLLGLDDTQLANAMGIAGTQASGLKANFGTMSKHLNAGNAAAVGVTSAKLAKEGFTGAHDVVESPQGFANAFNGDPGEFDPDRPGDGRLGVEKVMFKLHAACGGTHSAIGGIREIKARRPFALDEVDDVELVVSTELMKVCAIPEPTTSAEAMFSIRHASALALLDRPTGPASFSGDCACEPELIAARSLVRVCPTPRLANTGTPTELTIRLKNGEILEACVNPLVVTPDAYLQTQWNNLEAKFHDLVVPILGADRSHGLVDRIRRLDTAESIAGLVAATVP